MSTTDDDNVASFTKKDNEREKFSCDMVRGALNNSIDGRIEDVLITDVEVVDGNFDARASAVGRTYMYRILYGNKEMLPSMLHNMLCQKAPLFQKDRARIYPFSLDTSGAELIRRAGLLFV